MGRPRKPTALRLVESGGKLAARHRIRAEREPHPAPGIGIAPRYFTEGQRAIWKRVAAAAPPGMFTGMDRDLVEGFCVLAAAREDAAALYNATRCQLMLHSPDEDRLVLNPLLREYKRLSAQLAELGRDMGMSPISRTRISLPPPEKPADPLEEFLQPLR
jgi:P27 family predicted phage terminase small subunit